MGLAHQVPGLAMTAPGRRRDARWPHPDRAVRDEFHRRWTADTQAACGIDPDRARRTPAPDHRERDAAIVAEYQSGDDYRAIADRHGLSGRRVYDVLEAAGVEMRGRWGGPAKRTMHAESYRSHWRGKAAMREAA